MTQQERNQYRREQRDGLTTGSSGDNELWRGLPGSSTAGASIPLLSDEEVAQLHAVIEDFPSDADSDQVDELNDATTRLHDHHEALDRIETRGRRRRQGPTTVIGGQITRTGS